jgi:uncharacterized protein involved in exopolysaccharide biosynthesis
MQPEDRMNLTLRDLVAPLFRRWRVLVITFLSAFSVTAVLGRMYLHKYESHRVMVAAPVNRPPLVTAGNMNQAALEDADAGLRALGMSGGISDAPAPSAPVTFEEAELEREAKIDERNYLLYLSRREQERTSRALDRANVKAAVAVPATRMEAGIHSPVSIVVIAFAFAILASFLSSYLIDYCDPCFHTREQVINCLGIPVVIALPKRTVS